MKTVIVKTGQRYNPADVWKRVNPILMEGEMGIESDTDLFKFGDGKTPWNSLRYAGGGGGGGQVDTSLTQSGMAADAATTGQAIQAVDKKMFTGTVAEYFTAYRAGQIPIGTVVNLTDDNNEGLGGPVVVSSLPKAQSNYRGRAIILEEGDSDSLQICLKKSNGYQWFSATLSSQGNAGSGEEIDSVVAAGAVGSVMVVNSLPLAQSFYRGKSLVLETNGSDTLWMCLKKVGDYYWYEMKTSEIGVTGEDIPSTNLTTAILGSAILGQMILGKS